MTLPICAGRVASDRLVLSVVGVGRVASDRGLFWVAHAAKRGRAASDRFKWFEGVGSQVTVRQGCK